MQPEKTTAIILRVVDFSETSCVVTMMTRSHGKLTALAKGARRPKGPFEGALDLLAICNVVFIHKTSGAMDLLTEAKLDRRFKSGEKDLNRLYAGYYVAELLRILTDDADPHADAFDLAIRTLAQIEDVDSNQSLAQTLVEFELALLDTLGHSPMLTRCVSCGRDKTTIERIKFGLNDGGVICSGCRPGKSNVVDLSRNAFEVLLQLTGSDFASQISARQNGQSKEIETELSANQTHDSEKSSRATEPRTGSPVLLESNVKSLANVVKEEKLPADFTAVSTCGSDLATSEGFGEVRQLLQKYISHLVGYPPRLHAYLKNL
jgi:DNA repair protein RecO (recombination protein O)